MIKNSLFFCLFGLIIFTNQAKADTYYFSGDHLQPISESELAIKIASSDMLIIGEQHDSSLHHHQQQEILRLVGIHHGRFHLGMEFIDYQQQDFLDAYLNHSLSEDSFLKSVNWVGYPFSEYKQQIWAPLLYGGWTFGINLPRSISREISQKGIAKLSKSTKALLPPNYQIGSRAYFQRFEKTMMGHVPADAIQRYFEAQSMWDDTMAWNIGKHYQQGVFSAVIVGEFHVAYKQGLPARINARHPGINLLVISQLSNCDQLEVDKVNGVRADILIFSESCSGSQN